MVIGLEMWCVLDNILTALHVLPPLFMKSQAGRLQGSLEATCFTLFMVAYQLVAGLGVNPGLWMSGYLVHGPL